jgi:MYXO-CTERM domain-containing protein
MWSDRSRLLARVVAAAFLVLAACADGPVSDTDELDASADNHRASSSPCPTEHAADQEGRGESQNEPCADLGGGSGDDLDLVPCGCRSEGGRGPGTLALVAIVGATLARRRRGTKVDAA